MGDPHFIKYTNNPRNYIKCSHLTVGWYSDSAIKVGANYVIMEKVTRFPVKTKVALENHG